MPWEKIATAIFLDDIGKESGALEYCRGTHWKHFLNRDGSAPSAAPKPPQPRGPEVTAAYAAGEVRYRPPRLRSITTILNSMLSHPTGFAVPASHSQRRLSGLPRAGGLARCPPDSPPEAILRGQVQRLTCRLICSTHGTHSLTQTHMCRYYVKDRPVAEEGMKTIMEVVARRRTDDGRALLRKLPIKLRRLCEPDVVRVTPVAEGARL